jgi:hypothetical protein
MNTLVQKFNKYAAIVLATLTVLWTQTQSNSSLLSALNAAISRIRTDFNELVRQLQEGLVNTNNRVSDVESTIYAIGGQITSARNSAVQIANQYTEQVRIALESAIAAINLTVFGGRTKEQWEMYIANVVGTSISAEESRVNAMKEASEIVVVKLADYTGANIPFASIAKTFTLGNITTHMFKFEGALGATQTKRTVTGLPAQVNGATSIEVDNGDEIYVTYDAAGAATVIVYDDNEAAVVASVLTTQATHGGFINTLIDDQAALEAAFDAQAALVQTLFDQINSGGGYYYAAEGGIGAGNLGA